MFTLIRPDHLARAEVVRLGPDHYRVIGHIRGIALGPGGLGREYLAPGAGQRALKAAVGLVYGEKVPASFARSEVA